MAAINDIIIQIVNGAVTATGVNFGIPVLFGFTGSRGVVRWGTGTSAAVAQSVNPQQTFKLTVLIDVSGSYSYSIDSLNEITITTPPTARVRDLIADFNANAPTPVKNVISIAAVSTGSGPVAALAQSTATFLTYQKVQNISQLQYYYNTTDAEYKIVQNVLASAPSPGTIYLLDVYGLSGDNLKNAIFAVDNGDWYAALTTTTTLSLQQTLSDYFQSVKRVLFLEGLDVARLTDNRAPRTVYIIHDTDTHPEASWVAKNLPYVPRDPWSKTPNLQGQLANATATLSDLIAVRDAKGQSYVKNSGISYVDGSQVNDPQEILSVGQVIARDWIQINLELDLLSFFVQAAALGGNVPYTDKGIQSIVGVVANRLTVAGDNGLIVPVSTLDDAKKSDDGRYIYQITAMSRQQVIAAHPEWIQQKFYGGIQFKYAEVVGIDKISVTGFIVLG